MPDTNHPVPVVLESLVPAQVFAPGGVDPIITRIRAEVMAEDIDISTPAGRKRCASLAYKVAQSKTFLDDMGKKLVEDWKAQAKLVDAERRKVRDELGAIKDEVRRPLDEWEGAEKARVAGHEAAIAAFHAAAQFVGDSNELRQKLADVTAADTNRQEFTKRAEIAKQNAIDELSARLGDELRREAEAAELARLRAEAAERDRIARDEAIAARARAEAEAKAERERLRIEQETREREAAVKAEAERKEREAAEALARAEHALQAAQEATERAERERKAEAERARLAAIEAAQKAERDRIAAEEQDKRREIEAAQRERDRIAAEKKAEEAERARREADVAHRTEVNRIAMNAIYNKTAVDSADVAKTVVIAIAKGQIPGVTISY